MVANTATLEVDFNCHAVFDSQFDDAFLDQALVYSVLRFADADGCATSSVNTVVRASRAAFLGQVAHLDDVADRLTRDPIYVYEDGGEWHRSTGFHYKSQMFPSELHRVYDVVLRCGQNIGHMGRHEVPSQVFHRHQQAICDRLGHIISDDLPL